MSNEISFNLNRLVLARRRRALTKKGLSELSGISLSSISKVENGGHLPSPEMITSFASALNFPEGFFYGKDIDTPTELNASFRSFSRMTSGQRDAALAAGGIAYFFSDWVVSRFNLPEIAIPDCSGMEPEVAADAVRAMWGLGYGPIKNMIHLLESKGVRVFSLAEETSQVNAFSCWRAGVYPYVFLNTMKSGESSRFDAAHELGHLILHRHGENKGKPVENEANAFASAFLMPKKGMLGTAYGCKTVADVILRKKDWIVSAMAFTYRLHQIGLISEHTYKGLCIDLSVMGARKSEPESAPKETSQILQKVLGFLREKGVSVNSIAADISVSGNDLNQILFGLAPVMVTSTGVGIKTPPRANLRLVN
ncbi:MULTISPECIES: ImmA/IrrE family metallo-endopeptidase [Pseudomonas syringae group]|uniref:ImmA/IrrE family metallo-endopeptidase n=1 Tax=Pseudomonas syringae group TaxID=136849 RepID=UPI000F05CA90|nr:ImmA/IrrE family metallo-endopeptidase [Pseudomonas viridiflava]